jgi:hypothetical protein
MVAEAPFGAWPRHWQGHLPRRPVRNSAEYKAGPFSAVEAAAPALILPPQ